MESCALTQGERLLHSLIDANLIRIGLCLDCTSIHLIPSPLLARARFRREPYRTRSHTRRTS